MERVAPVLLAVGTTHPLNIAGVGLDARVGAELGVRVVTVIAGVSAQTAGAVLARKAVDSQTIAAQFASVAECGVAAIHIGALLDAASVVAIATEVRRFPGVPVVCDPVLAASNGGQLASDETVVALRDVLFARCTLITPNLDEAAMFLGCATLDAASMEAAARTLSAYGAAAVLIKGGHLSGDPTDVLVSAGGSRHFSDERITGTVRGTGDLLACAIAARLAHGDSLTESILAARVFVRRMLLAAVAFAGTRTVP